MLEKFKKIDIETVAGVLSFIGLGLQLVQTFVNGKVDARNDEQFKKDIAKEVVKEMKEQKRAKK